MELGPEYNLPSLTPVNVNIPDATFEGIIVGKAGTDIVQSHIVKCIDGTFPNETYQYDTIVAPITLIDLIDNG